MNQRNIAEETEDFLLENMAGFYMKTLIISRVLRKN